MFPNQPTPRKRDVKGDVMVIKGRHQARKEAAYLREKGSRNRRRRDEDHAQHKMGNGYRDNRSVGNVLKSFVLTLVSRNVKV